MTLFYDFFNVYRIIPFPYQISRRTKPCNIIFRFYVFASLPVKHYSHERGRVNDGVHPAVGTIDKERVKMTALECAPTGSGRGDATDAARRLVPGGRQDGSGLHRARAAPRGRLARSYSWYVIACMCVCMSIAMSLCISMSMSMLRSISIPVYS